MSSIDPLNQRSGSPSRYAGARLGWLTVGVWLVWCVTVTLAAEPRSQRIPPSAAARDAAPAAPRATTGKPPDAALDKSPLGPESTTSTSTEPAASADVTAVPAIFAGGVPTGVAELKRMQDHLQKVTERLLAATVGIRVGSAYGSGAIVTPQGMVITAAHVAQSAGVTCDVILSDGRVVRGKTLGLNRNLDAALVQILEPGPWPVAAMAQTDSAKAGQWCIATGHPGGYERGRQPVLRLGRILESSDTVLVSDCTLVGGDSGGPLFDAAGQVIGVHSRIGGMLTANLHVPIGGFRRSWERLEQGESWGHLPGQAPFLGVRGAAEADVARISEVFPDTPAARAGLRVGDIVTHFGSQPVTDFASLTDLVSKSEPGKTIKLSVRRGDEMLELELVVGKR
ncbi:MAG: trypsin-like peptidase domain-containing protein [Pirellulales bacterium]